MHIDITELDSSHAPKAASLFCSQYKKQREAAPDLPETYARPESVVPLIARALPHGGRREKNPNKSES
jgi:hypothetical protein